MPVSIKPRRNGMTDKKCEVFFMPNPIAPDKIAALRLCRQRLAEPVQTEQDYQKLFRMLSPVMTPYWCCPGDPPSISPRAAFAEDVLCNRLRLEHKLIKGRFQKGNIAYIFADELPLFGAVYRKEVPPTGQVQEVLELFRREGPLTVQSIKELTGMLVKEITPVLHKLQTAFLLCENQEDGEWDRAWYPFSEMFPDTQIDGEKKKEGMETIVLRAARMLVKISPVMLRSLYGFTAKEVKETLAGLVKEEELVFDGEGYLLPEDLRELENLEGEFPRSAFALQRNDYLVKAFETSLKGKYQPRGEDKDWTEIFYLLIDGEFQGAVLGKFHNGPFDLEDVVLDLPEDEAEARREEIIKAIGALANLEASPLKRYQGEKI